MEIIEEYFCWLEGQTEGDARTVKSDSVKEAARMAVDSWRHEGAAEMRLSTLLVNVKDPQGHIHQITITQDRYLDETGPQA